MLNVSNLAMSKVLQAGIQVHVRIEGVLKAREMAQRLRKLVISIQK